MRAHPIRPRIESVLLAAIHARALPAGRQAPAAPEAAVAPAVVRPSLRCHGGEPGGSGDDRSGVILRIDPGDGAVCVFRDSPVVAHFSRPLDPATVSAQAFRVWDDQGAVPGRLRLSPDGSVLMWEPDAPLAAYVHHFVISSGLRDARGRELAHHLSRFLTCDLMRRDISG